MKKEKRMQKYEQIYKLDDGNFNVSKKNNDEVAKVEYYAHTNIDEVYGEEGKWGLVDKLGKLIIRPKYIYPFIECRDNYQVMLPYDYKKINGQKKVLTLKHGLIDKKGKIIIPIKYLYMEAMDNTGTYFRVVDRKTYKSGVIDKNNKIVIPFNYEFIQASPDPELMIKLKNRDIYPDKIVQVKICNNDLYGIYDLKLKKEIIKPKYKCLEIVAYNKFKIGADYESLNTLINEKEEIISYNLNR